MGGTGSGEHNRTSRRTVEDCGSLSVADLRHFNLLPPTGDGLLGEGSCYVPYERVRLRLTATRQPVGGVRWWILCPKCNRRAGKLYCPVPERVWGCRICWDLGYRSRRMDPIAACVRRAERIRWPLECHGIFFGPPPGTPRTRFPKPKRMRWTTYRRILDRAYEYEFRAEVLFCQKLARLFKVPGPYPSVTNPP